MLEVFFYFHPERNSVGVSVVECFVEVFLIRLSGFWCGEVRPPQWAGGWGLGAALNPFPLFLSSLLLVKQNFPPHPYL